MVTGLFLGCCSNPAVSSEGRAEAEVMLQAFFTESFGGKPAHVSDSQGVVQE